MPPLLPVAVAAGGAVGGLARYGTAVLVPGPSWAATLAVNLAGCLLLGVLVGGWAGTAWVRPVVGTGVLGGFTTWSALAVETDRLLVSSPVVALLYVGATTAGGLALARVGIALGGRR